MAKKNTMNFLEAHIEKALLVLAVGFFAWVVFTRFVSPPNLSTDDGQSFRKISELAQNGSVKAQNFLENMKRDDKKPPPPIQQWADRFGKIEKTKLAFKPVSPFIPIIGGVKPDEKRLYKIPEIPELTKPKIILTHARALKPVSMDELDNLDNLSPAELQRAAQQGVIEADVDFVTVEAVIPFAQIRDTFRLNFAGPQVEKSLEMPEPIFADVELLRSRFLADQTWSPWEKVERLEGDQMREQNLPENMSSFSLTSYELLLKQRFDPAVQKLILQPQPYQLLEMQWLPPTQMAEQKEREKKDLRAARVTGLRNLGNSDFSVESFTSRSRPAARAPARPSLSLSLEEDDEDGGFPAQGRFRRPAPRSQAPWRRQSSWSNESEGIFGLKEWLDQEEIIIWAHDSKVEPGGVYRYLVRFGIFNPIAGRNWFYPQDRQLKNQLILWSSHTSPGKIVTIPERTLFFPNSKPYRLEDRSISVDVYRWVEGLWHKKDFRVSPGSVIGTTDKKEKTSAASGDAIFQEDQLEVDYSTNITVLDIVVNSSHWYRLGGSRASFRNVVTTDIIYLDTDGIVKRMGVDKRSWPEELNQKRSKIIKAIRVQKENFLTRN